METSKNREEYFETVSPSAKVLLFLKSNTDLPYAKEAAALVLKSGSPMDESIRETFNYWARVAHMEQRYKSINSLMAEEPLSNILELSSGYSFRGLAAALHQAVHYIDTDLPGIIELKRKLIADLEKGPLQGQLELLPLNALDEEEFIKITAHFKPGPIAIVNEGLLMYLDLSEKKRLCSIIHRVLKERGGYWITADIYFRNKQAQEVLRLDDPFQHFLDAHQVEEKKFANEEDAIALFDAAGFRLEKEAEQTYTTLSSFGEMIRRADPTMLETMRDAGKVHATWKLRIK